MVVVDVVSNAVDKVKLVFAWCNCMGFVSSWPLFIISGWRTSCNNGLDDIDCWARSTYTLFVVLLQCVAAVSRRRTLLESMMGSYE
ncbi:hypothetical protein BX666DRAFT_1954864 [Dichotomocladium elegans]|nr:hypothetical protein BX666DRAFT_1954864 [Dichotomocladium elegans]